MLNENIIEMKNVTKMFPGVIALNKIKLAVKSGQVHALLGENGAGKSTLIKILSGAIQADEGEIIYMGKSYPHLDPRLAISLGIGVIYQEFNLIPYLSVANNIFLGNEPKKNGYIDEKKCNVECKKLLDSLEIEISPRAQVKTLSVAYQQMVEIVKAVSKDVKLLIMDEPTAALSGKEVDVLLNLVKKLKSKGISVIYISHRLDELFEIADEITILRDGTYIKTVDINECTRPELISLMVGRDLCENYPKGCYGTDKVVLEAKNIRNNKLNNVSFTLHEGEVLGFGGLVGAGRTELARAIFGADKSSGEIYVNGKLVQIKSPRDAVKNGIAFITEDRKAQGLLMKLGVRENSTVVYLKKLVNALNVIDDKKEKEIAKKYISQLSIKTPDMEQIVSSLSGGNQQKVVLAKWLMTNAKIIIFDEPTRGIDVGVKFELYKIIKDLAKKGVSVIMISSDMEELLGVSDRIIVMKDGSINGVLSQEEICQENIMRCAVAN